MRNEWLQKHFAVVDTEDAAVAYLAALPGGEQPHVGHDFEV